MQSTTKRLVTAVIVLQGLILATQWSRESSAASRNELNLPDPGARQLQMVDELKSLNAKVDRLTTALTSGEIKVKVVEEKK